MPARLLLADDSVTIQRVIELTFAEEDVQVVAVGDGRSAIDQIQKNRPDIVLADVGMPERDGYDVSAFVKRTPDLADIPVLLLTGAFEPIDEGRAREAGCDGVLVKPFEPQMVINRVKELLAGRRPGAPVPAEQPAAAPPPPSPPPGGSAAETPPAPSGSLEDYFDRLDAAFATLGAPPPAAAPPSPAPLRQAPPVSAGFEDMGGWDPDLAPAAESASARPPAAARLGPWPAPPGADAPALPAARAPFEVPDGPAPTLAQAFAALLAAEQEHGFAPHPSNLPPVVPDAIVEAAVRRVLAEMTQQTVRETVLDVAERLVRDEIARIKSGAAS